MSNWDYRSAEPQDGNGCQQLTVILVVLLFAVLCMVPTYWLLTVGR